MYAELDAHGCARLPQLLTARECAAMARLYIQDEIFRSRVVMARHGFGRGEYRYFRYPLPALVQDLRDSLYPPLAQLANRWYERLGLAVRFPPTHTDFIERCHQAGQTRPTPLLLQYGADDFNCLHQDLYGEHVFPATDRTLVRARQRLRGRRVRAERATAAHAIARRGGVTAPGRCGGVRRESAARRRRARRLSPCGTA